ncbi:MAG: UvrD-helicase domain-containing protein, partial [Priestia megaterium]
DKDVIASQIMLITFTKKAASEMVERLQQMLPKERIEGIVYGTFHSVFLNRANNVELERVVKQTSAKIQRLEIARFSSLGSLASVNQHKEIINACRQKDAALTSQLVETNWLTLGEALTNEEEST